MRCLWGEGRCRRGLGRLWIFWWRGMGFEDVLVWIFWEEGWPIMLKSRFMARFQVVCRTYSCSSARLRRKTRQIGIKASSVVCSRKVDIQGATWVWKILLTTVHLPSTFSKLKKSVKQKPDTSLVSMRALAAVPTMSILTITP